MELSKGDLGNSVSQGVWNSDKAGEDRRAPPLSTDHAGEELCRIPP